MPKKVGGSRGSEARRGDPAISAKIKGKKKRIREAIADSRHMGKKEPLKQQGTKGTEREGRDCLKIRWRGKKHQGETKPF